MVNLALVNERNRSQVDGNGEYASRRRVLPSDPGLRLLRSPTFHGSAENLVGRVRHCCNSLQIAFLDRFGDAIPTLLVLSGVAASVKSAVSDHA